MDTHRLNVKEWGKNAVVVTLISDKTDFESKTIDRNKEEHCVIIKRSIHQEGITIKICTYHTSERLNTQNKF